MRISIYQFCFAALILFVSTNVFAIHSQTNMTTSAQNIFVPQDIQWNDAPNALPKGAKIAILQGDPMKKGPFTMRLKLPAGYTIPPHFHPGTEHVTVITGTFNIGHGDKFDKNQAKSLPEGSFFFMPPRDHHFAFADTETVIQLHGSGPWGITYLNPQDDPRKMQ